MGLFDFLKREAKDLGEAAEAARSKFDEELSERERELNMTPSEKIAALQQKAEATDAKFDQIAKKADGTDPALPNITHIVLPDGQVKSGANVAPGVVDDNGLLRPPTPPQIPSIPGQRSAQAAVPQASPEPAYVEPEPAPAPFEPPIEPVFTMRDPNLPRETSEPVAEAVQPPIEPVFTVRDPNLPRETSEPEPTAPADPVFVERDPVLAKESTAASSPEADIDRIERSLEESMSESPEDVLDRIERSLDTENAPVSQFEPDVAARTEATPPPAPAATPAATPSEPAAEAAPPQPTEPERDPAAYKKTAAQIKYEQARASANDLLDELRGELKADGEI